MSMTIGRKSLIAFATPTVSTSIYASGDQLGSLVEITSALDDSSGTGMIESISVVDKAKQASLIQVLFFRDKPVLTSVDNGALDISDAEMVDKCVGIVAIAAADYIANNVNSIATIRNVGLVISSRKSQDNQSGNSLWMLVRSGGTPTYTSTTDLVFAIGIQQDQGICLANQKIITNTDTTVDASFPSVTGTTVGAKHALDVSLLSNSGMAIRLDESAASPQYVGFAAIGSSNSAAVWQIRRLVKSSGITSITWADGDELYDNIWDDRASLTYS